MYLNKTQGQGLIGVIIVLVAAGLIGGGLYYYLSKQASDISETTILPGSEKEPEPDGKSQREEVPKTTSLPESPPESKEKSSIVDLPSLNPSSGLIVIKKGTSGENYMKEIASRRDWGVLVVDTSDHNQIKQEIFNRYNQKKFDYLLLIGKNEEIPYAVYNKKWEDESDDGWKTAPMLYGDVNNDHFIELAIGVLPFSSETKLRQYFADSTPRGSFITLENYTHHAVGGTGWEYYTYGNCFASAHSDIRNYKLTSALDLVSHYRESAMIVLSDAGSADAVYSAAISANPDQQIPVLHKVSFCKDFGGDIIEYQKGRGSECEMEYLTNRPIVIHYSCNNAQQLGPQLIENGASAFLGFLKGGGYFYQPHLQLLAGKTVGETMKNTYNFRMIGRGMKDEEGKVIGNGQDAEGLNTFDITNSTRFSPNITIILFGDPGLEIPRYLQQPDYNINIEQQTDEIVINVGGPKLLSGEVDYMGDLLCYAGEAVSHSSFIHKDNGSLNHALKLAFPVSKINKLVSQKAIIGGQEIVLSPDQERYSINLIKGKTEEYLVVRINATMGDEKSGRLDYTKDLQVLIEYE